MYRSVFISDLHLGSKHCQADILLAFLKNIKCENLYLVGDIIDGWRLQKKWYWPKTHSNVVKQIIRMSNAGVNVYWIAGNHDEFLRTFMHKGLTFGKINISNKEVYTDINGKRFLVVHGDMFDYLMRSKFGRTVMNIGNFAYDVFAGINIFYNKLRKVFGMSYWSMIKFLKHNVKQASNFVGQFEGEMCNYVKHKGYDGIICGHIHTPKISKINGMVYMNDGDFCENCTALVETQEGEWKIIRA